MKDGRSIVFIALEIQKKKKKDNKIPAHFIHEIKAKSISKQNTGAPNDHFLGNDLKWRVMHPGVF